jgi:transcriptional regulator with XRE-family HTH domain
VLCGLTQTELAEQLGITFQQLQKYENGSVRMSPSRLWRACTALGAPVSYFFEELNENVEAAADILSTRTWLDFIRYYEACPEDSRKQIYQSGKALTDILATAARLPIRS